MERRGSRKESEKVNAEEVRSFINEARGKFGSIEEGSGWRIEIEGSALNGVLTEPGADRKKVTTSKIYINIDPDDKKGQASLELNIYRNISGETHDSRHFALSVLGLTILNCSETVVEFDESKQTHVRREIKDNKAFTQTKNALQSLPGLSE